MFESVFPPELLVLDTPPHPIPANVRARVEVVKTELSTKRREAFIFSLCIWVLTYGVGPSHKEPITQKWLP